MLEYTHIFNTDVCKPYHIHYLKSDSPSIKVYKNSVFQFETSPTAGSKYTFTKYYKLPYSLMDYLVSGTEANYTKYINATIFREDKIVFIKNTLGLFLVKNNDTGLYYWSSFERTNFYFNPEYFSSEYLWKKYIGYVPTGKIIYDPWPEATAVDLFNSKVVIVEDIWFGERAIPLIEPIVVPHFNNDTEGLSKNLSVDFFLTDLQDLQNGDVLYFNSGKDAIEVTVGNCWTEASYSKVNTTTRPIIHVPIEIINPNTIVNYSKSLARGDQEDIKLSLYNNDIEFTIQRI